MDESDIYQKIKPLFPLQYKNNRLPKYLSFLFSILDKKIHGKDLARIPGQWDRESYKKLADKYSQIPMECADPLSECGEIATDLFGGIPRWRSPNLQYNVGAAVNTAATAMYALALDENIYNINDGLAGNALVAEQAVSTILANLAHVTTPAHGLFTFGGTATNLYALKIGTRKTAPDSGKKGMPKNLKVALTKDAHFSHGVSVDWLGIGTDNIIVMEPDLDRSSNLVDAESKLRATLEQGNLLAAIIINGGTTYGHVIDDIQAFAELRDRLVRDYSLSYKPHLHVDSVIGWAWLVFKDYDFDKNELSIEDEALEKIKKQYQKISKISLADSWGVDFHKGVGACPIDCSIVMMNDISDFVLLSKKGNPITAMHQLAQEFSFTSPADFTLETSRSGGAALAALASLHTLGIKGYQRNLANLVQETTLTKKLLSVGKDVMICDQGSLGYVTMIRFYPPELNNDPRRFSEFTDKSTEIKDFVEKVNNYTKAFFQWDSAVRMSKNKQVEYSFSSNYLDLPSGGKLSAIKLYPVSPHFDEEHARETVQILFAQKRLFDTIVWLKR